MRDVVLDDEFVGGFRVADERVDHGIDVDVAVLSHEILFLLGRHRTHQRAHIVGALGNRDRITRQHIVLHIGDISLQTVRQRQHQRNADYADSTRDARKYRSRLFRKQILRAEPKRGERRHFRFFRAFLRFSIVIFGRFFVFPGLLLENFRIVYARLVLLFLFRVRISVAHDFAVEKANDTRGVLLGKFGVVRDHNNEFFLGNLADKVHDLHARGGVERARRLVGKQNFRFVHERTRDCHALALSAGELVRALVVLTRKPHAVERFFSPLGAFRFAHARDRQREFDVAQHGLVRDKIVTLKNKADAVVAVNVPVAVAELPRAYAVDADVARSVLIQPADNIEKRGFAAARRT